MRICVYYILFDEGEVRESCELCKPLLETLHLMVLENVAVMLQFLKIANDTQEYIFRTIRHPLYSLSISHFSPLASEHCNIASLPLILVAKFHT